jgi:hypothetical protein
MLSQANKKALFEPFFICIALRRTIPNRPIITEPNRNITLEIGVAIGGFAAAKKTQIHPQCMQSWLSGVLTQLRGPEFKIAASMTQ